MLYFKIPLKPKKTWLINDFEFIVSLPLQYRKANVTSRTYRILNCIDSTNRFNRNRIGRTPYLDGDPKLALDKYIRIRPIRFLQNRFT